MMELFLKTVNYLKNVNWALVIMFTFMFYLGRGFQKFKDHVYRKYFGEKRNKLEF